MNEIKRQLLDKTGNTSERAIRVRRLVNEKIQLSVNNQTQFNYYVTLITFLAITLFSFLIFLINDEKQLNTEQPTNFTQDPNNEIIGTVPATVEKGEYFNLLSMYYFPSNNAEATYIGGFENGGEILQTYWLNEHYVQQISSNDGGIVERIYRLNGNQIELVSQEMLEQLERTYWSLEELNNLPIIEIVLKVPFNIGDVFGEWKVIETDGVLLTPYGNLQGILVLENKKEDFRIRKYYSLGYGEVKTETEFLNTTSGEFEAGATTELETFNFLLDSTPEQTTDIAFDKNEMITYDAKSHSGWKTSPLGKQQATIDGKLEHASEEGEAVLVIENSDEKKFTVFQLNNNPYGQYTPKYVEWIDEERVFVIVGLSYGTVTMGGNLYVLDIIENSVTPIFEDPTGREEIMSITANTNGTFDYEKHIYIDENFSEGTVENGTLPFPE